MSTVARASGGAGATPAQQPLTNGAVTGTPAVAANPATTNAQQQTRPAGNHTSNHSQTTNPITGEQHQQQQQQQQPSKPNSTSSSTLTSRPSLSMAFTAPLAESLLRKVPLPVSDRSHYKTYILTNGVFEVESRFIMKELIGQGAYGVVCSAFDIKNNRMVAIKKIENVFDHRSLAKRTLRELKIVRSLVHENILGLERVIRPHSSVFDNVYMVSELMETDLACVIRSPQELTEEHCQFFIYQVLRGLKYIHSIDVIHRDLKPRNLLVNSNCDLKICDFGLARVDDPQHRDRTTMSNYIATRWYRAPEVILGRKKYTKAVDMWSIGCILAELIGRKPIFPGRDSFHQITLICSILGTPPNNDPNPKPSAPSSASAAALAKFATSSSSSSSTVNDEFIHTLPHKNKVPFSQLYPHATPQACDLLDKLLCFDPEKRLTVAQALAHPYLEELHCEDDEPVCKGFDYSEHYFEYLKTSKEDLRYLIHDEIVNHYPEEKFDPKTPQAMAVAAAAGFGPPPPAKNGTKDKNKDALASFAAQMGGALPKGAKKTRRKSI